MKKVLILGSMAVLMAGCYTNDADRVERGGTASDPVIYRDADWGVPPVINTNSQFAPVNSGAEAAKPPGTSSGGTLRTRN
jgi:hypothetical protein